MHTLFCYYRLLLSSNQHFVTHFKFNFVLCIIQNIQLCKSLQLFIACYQSEGKAMNFFNLLLKEQLG